MANDFRITRSARKHRVGVAHMREALENAGDPIVRGDAHHFVGTDSRGVELELVLVPNDKGEGWSIIHAMPTHYRK